MREDGERLRGAEFVDPDRECNTHGANKSDSALLEVRDAREVLDVTVDATLVCDV